MFFRVLHRKGHKKFAVDGNDVKRGIGIRQLRIDKRWRRGQGVKIDIIHFHHAAPEIGGIQAGHAICIRGDGESFIDGARLRAGVGVGEVVAGVVNRDDPLRAKSVGAVEARGRGTDTGVPADNCPILGCKEEASRSRRRLIVCVDARNHESWRGARQSCDIEDGPGRCPTAAHRRRDADDEPIDSHRIRCASRNIIERC